MTCLKCGRETDQTFCEGCRAVMEKYPVSPETVLHIPKRRVSKRNTNRRTVVTLETRLERQLKLNRHLSIALAIMTLAVAGLIFAASYQYRNGNTRPTGQNYSTVAKPTEEATEAAQ